MLDNPFSCRCVRRNCQESYFRKAIICPKMSLSDGRLFAAHGRICKFYPFPGSPPRRELRAATHPKRATKTAFRKCKRRIERHFGVPYRSDFRFGRRRPLFFIFIACESLFGCRVVFARTDHLQGFFQNFIASGMQTFDRGMYRYIDPHTRRAGVRIVRIINSETEST